MQHVYDTLSISVNCIVKSVQMTQVNRREPWWIVQQVDAAGCLLCQELLT